MSTIRTRIGRTQPDLVAVTALGCPEEPSKADLLRAFRELPDQVPDQVMAGFTEIRRALTAPPDPPSPGRAAEPLPPNLNKSPMRGFLIDGPG